MNTKILLFMLAMVFILVAPTFAVTISVDSISAKSGDTVDVNFNISLESTDDVSAFNFDFNYDSSILSIESITEGPATIASSKMLAYNNISSGIERILVYGYDATKLSSGIFMTVSFKINNNAANSNSNITLSNLSFASSLAEDVNGSGSTGTITIDNDGPTITITSPTDGDEVNNSTITINGSIDDLNVNNIDINGNTVNVINGDFTYNLSLSEGANSITVTAVDAVGNSSSETISITLDTTAPNITITSPSNGDKLNTNTITVSGTIDDTNITQIDINGETVSVNNGSFTTDLSGVEGNLTITVTATDNAGNTATKSINVEIDLTAPVVNITAPNDGDHYGRKSIVVSGTVDDNNISSIDINGNTVNVSEGSFSQSITFDEGDITIIATAIDEAGNSANDSIDINITMGDVNEDGVIDISDINNTKNQILGITSTTIPADVNSDNNVNVLDLQLVINKS